MLRTRKSKHNEKRTVEELRKSGVKFHTDEKHNHIADASHILTAGLKTLGKLDYLGNVCGYVVQMPQTEQGRGLAKP